MSLRRRLLIAAACGAVPLSRAGATGSNPPIPRRSNIGALFPLSGADSLIGDEALRGVQLAAEASGFAEAGTPGLIVADAGDQAHAEQAARTLIAGNGVGLLLGSGASSLAYPGSAAAELAQLPYIELNAEADGITGRSFKFLLRTCLTTSMLAATAIQAAASRFPGGRIGLLFNTGATAGAIAAAALAQWRSAGAAPLLSIGYPEDSADLHDAVERCRRAGIEILLHAAGADDVLVFFQALQDTGWRPKAVIGCGAGYGLRETAQALGPVFNATLVSAAPCYPAAASGIAEAYRDRFGMDPRSAESLTAYVGARLVLQTLDSVNGDPSRLLAALRATHLPEGGLANGWGVSFDRAGQNTGAFATLQQWRGGALLPAT